MIQVQCVTSGLDFFNVLLYACNVVLYCKCYQYYQFYNESLSFQRLSDPLGDLISDDKSKFFQKYISFLGVNFIIEAHNESGNFQHLMAIPNHNTTS